MLGKVSGSTHPLCPSGATLARNLLHPGVSELLLRRYPWCWIPSPGSERGPGGLRILQSALLLLFCPGIPVAYKQTDWQRSAVPAPPRVLTGCSAAPRAYLSQQWERQEGRSSGQWPQFITFALTFLRLRESIPVALDSLPKRFISDFFFTEKRCF